MSATSPDGTFDYLRVGPLADLVGAPYIGNPRIYHQTNDKLDQVVLVKAQSGPVVSGDLGRTAQVTLLQSYDGVLDTGLGAVNVASSVLNVTNNVGSVSASRGSAIGQQNVVTVGSTNTSAGPNEYANTVQLLDPTIGKANGGNTYWQNDYTANGPKDGPEYNLYGTVQAIHKYNSGTPTSGQATIGSLVTTRPAGGAGFQNRVNHSTFPVDIGFGVSGFSGVNNSRTLQGGHAAGATEGFRVAFKAGGKQGPWLNEPGKYNGGSKIGVGFSAEDHTDAGVSVGATHPSTPTALAIRTAHNAGDVALGGGDWNTSHLRFGNTHVWVDSSGNLRKKNGSPGSSGDGVIVGGGGITGPATTFDSEVAVFSGTTGNLKRSYYVFKPSWAGNVTASGTATKLPAGWTVTRVSVGTYLLTTDFPLNADNYGISATCRDAAPGWVRRTLANGTGFYVETVDGAGTPADRAFGFTALLI